MTDILAKRFLLQASCEGFSHLVHEDHFLVGIRNNYCYIYAVQRKRKTVSFIGYFKIFGVLVICDLDSCTDIVFFKRLDDVAVGFSQLCAFERILVAKSSEINKRNMKM